ncbi:hypothetical protein WI88_22120 [Burkholderia ubonensis]|nr:hypothetical protein WI88_22120 [Burkholderia ubonensis]KWO21545.1 hypothetical protein WM25_10630 [Burkholderia ubonensis]
MPFFRKYFQDQLTQGDMIRFDRAHHSFSKSLGFDVKITNAQFDEMKRVVDENSSFFVRHLLKPSAAIEPFRPYVVSSQATDAGPSANPSYSAESAS